jgi:putative flippase GtrA
MPKRLLSLIRFGIVGVGTVVIDVITYSFLVGIGLHYLAADIINVPLVLVFNFLAHKFFTFKTPVKQTKREIRRYALNVMFNFVMAVVLLATFVSVLGASPVVGKLIQVVALPLINFLLLEKFVFKGSVEPVNA